MTINKYVNRLKRIDQLIQQQRTGNAKALAQKLGMCERQVYNILEELRDFGIPVEYCRVRQTYYYTEPLQLHIDIGFVNLTTLEVTAIEGGGFFYNHVVHCNPIAVDKFIFEAQFNFWPKSNAGETSYPK